MAYDTQHKRSPCPVSCMLDILGDKWSLLIIRDLFLNKSRFKEFAASAESIPTNILSDRLKRLLNAKIITQDMDGPVTKHPVYRLTKQGRQLGPLLLKMKAWGLQWIEGTKANSNR